ncbi:MAG: NADH:flavin oxidoreductase [Cyclobacteriaceae bacterium]|jgi:NADPH2 dehydrogenase
MAEKFKPKYSRVAQLKTADDFKKYLVDNEIDLPFDAELTTGDESPYQQTFQLKSGKTIGNRFSILPMEGWDGTTDGKPTEYTKRRWKNFAISGAKLLWGGEAFAVMPEGRANPNQLMALEENFSELKGLYQLIMDGHKAEFGKTDDLCVGFQLTHSGRFCKPYDKKKSEPRIAYHHPILDPKFGIDSKNDQVILSDQEIDHLIERYVAAAKLAQKAGFDFVDIKHCHGYLGHEILSGYHREGKYGGSFENRTRFLRDIVAGIHAEAPGLEIGVRLSSFDWVPFTQGEDTMGVPEKFSGDYEFAFGGGKTGTDIDLSEPFKLIELMQSLGIQLVCFTAGSPYYNPHIQRPALFPPSDGYQPPEDPLQGVARQIKIAGDLKKAFPDIALIGSAYSYLQEWLPNVGQYVLRNQLSDFIGLGRMVLSYPDLPRDVLEGKPMARKKICRTFSDCTTAPRNGMISGCFPLDPFYKELPEAKELKTIKTS